MGLIMARRKTIPQEGPKNPSLVIPRSEADEKIKKQVEKGKKYWRTI